jgi:serine O-acetyltransferase
MGQVTIGKNFHDETHIEIGNNVFVGTGAKIIGSGKLRIASGVVIGANGVVTKDLSKENGVYVGVPVKYLKQNQHKNKLASWKI